MNEQELRALLGVYQRRLNESQSQAIALEAKVVVQQEIIGTLQKQLEETPKRNTKKIDPGEF